MSAPHAHDVLAVLAELAPDTRGNIQLRISDADRKVLPYDTVAMMRTGAIRFGGNPDLPDLGDRVRARIQPFLKLAKLHEDEELVRIGWLWLTGRFGDVEVRLPLVSAALRPPGPLFVANPMLRLGDLELTDLIDDADARSGLEDQVPYGDKIPFGGGATDATGRDFIDPALLGRLPRLHDWAIRAANAAGFPTRRVTARPLDDDTPHIVAQVAIYVAEPVRRPVTVASTLRSWPKGEITQTAFGAMYVGDDAPERPTDVDEPVESSIVLSPAQARIVARSRHAPVTVVSGPPGTGKTQTIAAVALDVVERGRSVLVAAPSTAAVDALIELLTVTPGPDPVVFGSSDRRAEVADRIGQGGGRVVDAAAVRTATERYEEARHDLVDLRDAVAEMLDAEHLAADADPVLRRVARDTAPRWFEPGADLDGARRRLRAVDDPTGPFHRWRQRRRLHLLRRHAGASDASLVELSRALRRARAEAAVRSLARDGGLELDRAWTRLVDLDQRHRHRRGEWLHAITHDADRISRRERSTMAAVAAALRSGRANRRRRLGELDGRRVTGALPLWIGTLRDIDDLLPRTGGMFDVVIVDEASQVDQIAAAPALLRARHAVIVGDPKQLRHVSFLSDDRVRAAIAARGLSDADVAEQLDVRRLSAFDVAAGVAPTQFLDEHFRSAPHLIDFSARRFYDGALTVATRHPRNHAQDCISVVDVGGSRDGDGAVPDEIDVALRLVRNADHRSIGIVTPFRAQADGLEAAVMAEFELEDITRLGLRVGTVHGFQGCERDLVIISLGLGADAAAGSRTFAGDPNLFNVMITRAREEIVVVSSVGGEGVDLIADYLRYGERPPPDPEGGTAHRMAHTLADELTRSGTTPILGYPVGRHHVDLVLGAGDRALGVLVGVHPDGPAAHVARHLALRRADWDIREVFESRWGDRIAELAVELAIEARHRSAQSDPA